jgi:hypothetical protein
MRLATPEDVLAVLNIGVSTGSLASAAAALDATLSDLERKLDTKLSLQEQTDYFLVPARASVRTLRLSNSFISEDTELVLRYHEGGPSSTGYTIASTDYLVDTELGMVKLLSPVAAPTTLSVAYSSGFSERSGVALDAPAALTEAHATLACAFLQMNPANVAKDKAKSMGTASINGYQQAAVRATSRYVRPRGTCMWADLSVITQ